MNPKVFDLNKGKFTMPTPPEGKCEDVHIMKEGVELGILQVCGIKDGAIEINQKSNWEQAWERYQKAKGEK